MNDKNINLQLDIKTEGQQQTLDISENAKIDSVWFTADTHYMHQNIIRLCNRPYSSLRDMEEDMVNRWNQVVKEDDLVFFLGDFSMNMLAHKIFFQKLKFGRMVFIVGNHDKKNKLISNISSMNISDKFFVSNDLILRYKKHSFFLTHRPINAHSQMPTLCGHVHEKWKFMARGNVINEGAPESSNFKSITLKAPVLNVGVDQFDFYPINLKYILSNFDFGDV